jgi:hypothetical protein
MKNARLVVGGVAVALACSWAGTASAQQDQKKPKKYIATRQITVDQQTGALRLPTPEETQDLVDRLTAMTNRATDGLQTRTLPNGAQSVNLEGRFESVMLVRPNADGTSEIRCVNSFEEAADFLGLIEDPSQR